MHNGSKPIIARLVLNKKPADASNGSEDPNRGEKGEQASPSVLVVDDDPANAKLLSILIHSEGYRSVIARSAEDAVCMLAYFRPRLIVLDLVLPLMSGLLFAQRLKANPKTQDITIVAVTAFNGSEAEQMAREAGCAAYIRKPIDPVSFTQLLLAYLGSSR
jgi:CheY-like chemotaxis protein